MSELSRFKIVLDGTIMPNANREEAIRALCELFHSRPSRMAKLLGGNEVSLKKEYTRGEAKNICRAIRDAGARCKIVVVEDTEIELALDDNSLSDFSENRAIPSISCPACGKDCDANWLRCRHCDFLLGTEDESEQETPLTVENVPTPSADQLRPDVKPAHQSDMRDFVGPNSDYYLGQFAALGSIRKPKFRPTWHWPALFVFPFWALYRKLWLWAGLYYLGSMAVVMLGGSTLLLLIYSVVWPLTANFIYYLHASKQVRALGTEYEPAQRKQILSGKGGVSKIALWLGIAVSFALSTYMMSTIRDNLLEAYDEQFGGGADRSTLVYGDGQPLNGAGETGSPLATTVEHISTITDALKIVIASGNQDTLDRTLEGLESKTNDKGLLDGWNNPIHVARKTDVVELRSPGEDGKLKNDDDIVQAVPFEASLQ